MARSAQDAVRFREREALIVERARRIAETEGWPAVTVRRLAEAIGFSQPILYRHFPGGRDEIVDRIVIDGYTELAIAIGSPEAEREQLLAHVIAGYLAFAAQHPAVYEAMSSARTGFDFAAAETPAVLRDGFAIVARAAGGRDDAERTVRAELLWSLLHGVSGLSAGGRLDPSLDGERERAIAALFA